MDPHTENAYEQYAEDSVNEFESESLWSEKHQNLKSYCGGCYEKLKDLMADERAFHPQPRRLNAPCGITCCRALYD